MKTNRLHRNTIIRPYLDSDWETVRLFILAQWGFGHPMAERRLFEWQFRGFGTARGASARPLLLFIGDEMAGFRGIIPGLYQVPSGKGMVFLPGGSLAMWKIRKEYRGHHLGSMMHREAEAILPVITGAGSNPTTSVPIYLQNGFQLLPSLYRYLTILDPRACIAVFGEQASGMPCITRKKGLAPIDSSDIPAVEMEQIWKDATFKPGFFSLFRNEEFWRWRYFETPGFKYIIFKDPEGSGFLVSRVEELISPESTQEKQLSILRIIEMVPSKPSTWLDGENVPFTIFLCKCLNWANEAGCIAADFHCSSKAFGELLIKAGFASEQDMLRNGTTSLPSVFNGTGYAGRPINALVKAPVPISFEKTYFVKSDNDMDRPRRLDENGQIIY